MNHDGDVTAEAAQGWILLPDLWNVFCDYILCIKMPEGTFLIAYADDTTAVVLARNVKVAQMRLNQVIAIEACMLWLEEHGLYVTAEKKRRPCC